MTGGSGGRDIMLGRTFEPTQTGPRYKGLYWMTYQRSPDEY